MLETATEVRRPFPFGREDLDPERIGLGVRQTLDHYFHWRDDSPGVIAAHVDGYTEQLRQILSRHGAAGTLHRAAWPPRRRREERAQAVRELNYFGVYNLSEIPGPADVARAERLARVHAGAVRDTLAAIEGATARPGWWRRWRRAFPGCAGCPRRAGCWPGWTGCTAACRTPWCAPGRWARWSARWPGCWRSGRTTPGTRAGPPSAPT
ncbi:hypothetical protein ACFQY4_07205 [Catellatospora bangladeshensis]|uniref:hypothetical protein n=1 Tax=Catellatospora bangladeshensis TaxID=310355 RepID=UPI00361B8B45